MYVSHDVNRLTSPGLDAQKSLWVEASAGTGKTKLLTDRVLSLLLQGVPVDKILCLTFTNAAASEMQNRIRSKLMAWATLSPEDLLKDLAWYGPLTSTQVAAASRLFASSLMGGESLRIQTLHGFCQSLLQMFPFEAGLLPGFRVMDESESLDLWDQACASIIQDRKYKKHVQYFAAHLSEAGFQNLMGRCYHEQHKWAGLANGMDAIPESLIHNMWNAFALSPDVSDQEIYNILYAELPRGCLRELQEILPEGREADQKMISVISEILRVKTGAEFKAQLPQYQALFLAKTGTLRKRLLSKKMQDKYPEETVFFIDEAARVYDAVQEMMNHKLCCASAHLMHFFHAAYVKYKTLKLRQGALDYDDLMQKTHALLRKSEVSDWILYKLDGGFHHILIDEAQDTNRLQWEIVDTLTQEFFGASEQENIRSLFVVGDTKQSIYSFQGAEPQSFSAYKTQLSEKIHQGGAALTTLTLDRSYRSTAAVLSVVDQVFSAPELAPMLEADTLPLTHQVHRTNHPGRVEIWPLIPVPEKPEQTAWGKTQEETISMPPQQQLALLMADRIETWLRDGKYVPSVGRAIRPQDIMILVRKRSAFVEYMVTALKAKSIPVAGIDRIQLKEEIAIQDLLALAAFLLLPDDDFTLAVLLKSPLFSWTEEDLFALAHGREGKSLWRALQTYAVDNPLGQRAVEYLTTLLRRVDYDMPSEIYASVLFQKGGREKFLERLGPDCLDPLTAFLNLCQEYEKKNPPSMEGFVAWIDAQDITIKRNLEHTQKDEVRILTVHGAKGLQSPIVMLPDTTQKPMERGGISWGDDFLCWMPPGATMTEKLAQLKLVHQQAALKEYYRLLYVALTRAQDDLYIGGWMTSKTLDPTSWYGCIMPAVAELGEKLDGFDTASGSFEGQGWVYENDVQQENNAVSDSVSSPVSVIEPPQDSPLWLMQDVTSEKMPTIMYPSQGQISGTTDVEDDGDATSNQARERGILIHKLLEYLPPFESQVRLDMATIYVTNHTVFSALEQQTLVQEVLGVIESPDLAPYFGPDSYAEVSVQGTLDGEVVRGQVDRIFKDTINKKLYVLDFKTGQRQKNIPLYYRQQLQMYGTLFQHAYKGFEIKKGLIWTATATVEFL